MSAFKIKQSITALFIIIVLFSGCNEFIDLSGKFINSLNNSNNLNLTLKVSACNFRSENLPNILISLIDDHDSVCIVTSKFTDESEYITFLLPEEQINSISPEANSLIVIAEHPDAGIYTKNISLSELASSSISICNIELNGLSENFKKRNIKEYQIYNQIQNNSIFKSNNK